jgi:D-glycero-D-manno-heptose 1,7-bisphosphate phosphatase
MKILLVDCDGTIRQPKSKAKFINKPNDQEPIPGAVEAINHYHSEDWLIVGITNQAGVAAGHKSPEDCIKEQQYTLKLFPQIQSILFCPDFEGRQCYRCYPNQWFDVSSKYRNLLGSYRKPGAGMIQHVLISNEADRLMCWMIGDRPEDERAAKSAEVNFMWADIWRERWRTGEYKV